MILIGQYDSSFVRRVGIVLTLYDMPFEQRPWSVYGDAEKIRPYNPLLRVPVLVLDNGEVLLESGRILDHLDVLVEPARRLFPANGTERRRAMRIAALATGMADKGVSLFYEMFFHEHPSADYVARCTAQILDTLGVLEEERSRTAGPYWFGEAIGHADIAVAAALRHVSEAHPGLIDWTRFAALRAHAAALEALPVFQAVAQPFVAPAVAPA